MSNTFAKGDDHWTCVLFDVDGTLVDSAPMVIDSFVAALSGAGLPVPDRAHLSRYVGPPLWWSFSDLGYDHDTCAHLITKYRAIYTKTFLDPQPFPGVTSLIRQLADTGLPLATATSKQEFMALRQMEHLGLAPYFRVIAGATPSPDSTKATVIASALSQLADQGVDVARPVLVGDSIWDVTGGHEAGVPVIAVEWGYGDEDGLADADMRVSTPEELRDLLDPR
ncbi:HAD hydrolase-like protein [Schaalia sp. ZJ1691]|uniref:HAD hydrolase-like protein n=1 Tax=Schaalia sp. ZJ1691 TaxID=2709404 RepID=UPI00198249C5|nr:HAD hydrolase-like protein [Schaalia sp. ZJ1691]